MKGAACMNHGTYHTILLKVDGSSSGVDGPYNQRTVVLFALRIYETDRRFLLHGYTKRPAQAQNGRRRQEPLIESATRQTDTDFSAGLTPARPSTVTKSSQNGHTANVFDS